MASSLVKRIQNTIFEHQLLTKSTKIIVGVSGGPDSVCLLNILYQLKDKYQLQLAIVHVNYGLRGKDSDADERLVKTLARRYDLEAFFHHPTIHETANLESRLRDIRYAFFETLRKKQNFDLIAVAHNQDDQVETFFSRIIRGSGLTGLSAMKYKNGQIIRPLLSTPRSDIILYLKENQLKFRIDKTNRQLVFFRNKIRNKLIPYLEKNFNPNIKETIFNSLVSIAQDCSYLEIETARLARGAELSVSHLKQLHPALQRRLLLSHIQETKGDLKNIEAAHITEILKIITSTKGKSQVVIFKRLKVTRKGDKLVIDKLTNN